MIPAKQFYKQYGKIKQNTMSMDTFREKVKTIFDPYNDLKSISPQRQRVTGL